jgi:hypothetical protein
MSAFLLAIDLLAKTLQIFADLTPQNSQPRSTPESWGEVTAASSKLQG